MDTRVQGSPAAPPPAPPAVAGDLVGECTLLCKQLQGQDLRTRRQGVQRSERKRSELKRLRQELARKQRAAKKKSMICKWAGRITGAIMAAVGTVASIYCPAAAGLVALGAALVTGALEFGGAAHQFRADGAQRAGVRTEGAMEEAAVDRSEELAALDEVVQREERTSERLVALLSSRAEGRRLAAGLRPGGEG